MLRAVATDGLGWREWNSPCPNALPPPPPPLGAGVIVPRKRSRSCASLDEMAQTSQSHYPYQDSGSFRRYGAGTRLIDGTFRIKDRVFRPKTNRILGSAAGVAGRSTRLDDSTEKSTRVKLAIERGTIQLGHQRRTNCDRGASKALQRPATWRSASSRYLPRFTEQIEGEGARFACGCRIANDRCATVPTQRALCG